MEQKVGLPFYFKYEGLNPSLSFKDRGMACALSFLNYLTAKKVLKIFLLYVRQLAIHPRQRHFILHI